MTKLSIAERLQFSTVKLTVIKGGQPIGTGTGFFFEFLVSAAGGLPTIITNKHVPADADLIRATCHLLGKDGSPTGKSREFDIPNNPYYRVDHPNAEIDLCAFVLTEKLDDADQEGLSIFYGSLTKDLIPSKEEWDSFDAIEDVTMIGYPRGISDEVNNFPIARNGITASSLTRDYNGRKEFVVDMACFPGSSGSPVFLLDRNGYRDKQTGDYHYGGTRLRFVGILYSGPTITHKGEIILATQPSVEVAAMMHLGNVIKSSELTELEEHFRNKRAK
ncbi:hypothetical protein D3C77_183040 [compost metagenome]